MLTDVKLSLPITLLNKCLWPLKSGFLCRIKLFPWLKQNRKPDPSSLPKPIYFGYIEYPAMYTYATPKGFRDAPKPFRIKNPKAVQARAVNFFSTVICDFECRIESSLLNIDSLDEQTADNIVEKVINPLARQDAPSTVLIKGAIGCGKSTLISSVMHALWKKESNNQGFNNLPICVDLRETLKDLIDPVMQKGIPNNQNFCDRIEEVLCQRIRKLLRDAGIKIQDPNPTFSEIVKECHARQMNPIFIFDELDTLYYSFCTAYAEPTMASVSHERLLSRYCTIVNYFFNLSSYAFSPKPLMPVFIIAGRLSTLELINEVRMRQENLGKDNYIIPADCIITIESPTTTRVVKIMKAWISYYLDEVKKEGNETLVSVLSNLQDDFLNKPVPDYSKNLKISVHGLRHIMKVLGKAVAHDPSGKLLSFFIKNPNFMRVYQYLDGCEEYSQTIEGVSNIFLVNDEFKSDHEKLSGSVPEKLYVGHLQTYWLKYFIIKYACYHKRKHGEGMLTVQDIISLFCEKPGSLNEKTHYELEVVMLLIIHACEVTHGRLVKFGITSGSSATLIASERANIFDQENLYWDFSYLFVCIEDEWLPFPKFLTESFILDEPWKRAFNFSASYESLTTEEKLRFIKYKAVNVMLFIAVLDAALISERRRCRAVFYRLEDADKEIFSFKNYVDNKRKIVIKSIMTFTKDCVGPEYSDEVEDFIKSHLKSLDYCSNVAKIKTYFAIYDRSWSSFRSGSAHMKKHYKNRAVKSIG